MLIIFNSNYSYFFGKSVFLATITIVVHLSRAYFLGFVVYEVLLTDRVLQKLISAHSPVIITETRCYENS